MEIQILKDIVQIFAISIVVILLFHRIRVPAIVGFLLTGVLIGPHGLGLISAVHEVEILAEIGVVLLLFTIGIEFSLRKLMQIKKAVLLGGSVQVVLTILASAVIISFLKYPANKAIFFGFLIALSSTAIVLKVLQDRAEINSPHGQTAMAILIFQDIVIVFMILATPILAGESQDLGYSLLMLGLKVAGIILLTIVLAKWVVHGVFYQVVRTRSRELFLLSVVALCLGIAWLTSSIGLSLAMGAFLAGLIISESEYSQYAFSQIVPFRDLFTSFFFVSIGMLLDISYVLANPLIITAVVAGLVLLKALITCFVGTLLGLSFRAALLVGFSLAQVGEFSFILSRFGLEDGLISADIYQLFLAASVISMAATPFIIAASPRLADLVLKLPLPNRITAGFYPIHQTAKEESKDHLIIVGFGINGRNVARAAKISGIPYVIIEMNPATVRSEQSKGEAIFFGDATREAVLKHAGIDGARVLVVAIPDAAATEGIADLVRSLNSSVHVIIRTRFLHEVDRLYQLGADEIIPEEFETSIQIFTRVLRRYSVPEERVNAVIAEIRSECYGVFRKTAATEDLQARLDS